jgi:hypothetical protein
MRRYNFSYCAVMPALLLAACAARAEAPPDEVEYLLSAIEASGCQFDRNGSVHDSAEARDHIARKYRYVKKRVDSSEEFIEYAASRSSISGKPYHIVCGEERVASETWLLESLQRYRDEAQP